MAAWKQSRMPDQAEAQAPTVAISNAPATGVSLYVRLWAVGEAGESAPAFRENMDPAACLTTDLIAAAGGVQVETHGQVFLARFPALQTGILAARRLLWAAQGFSETSSLRETALAVLVQHPDESLGAAAERTVPHVLEHAAPGQILITESVAKVLEDMAGFSMGDVSEKGFRELLWRGRDDQTTRSFDERVVAWFIEQKGPEVFSEAYPEEPVAPAFGGPLDGAEANREARADSGGASPRGFADAAQQRRSGMLWLTVGATAAVLLLAAIWVLHPFGAKEPSTASTTAQADVEPATAVAPTPQQPPTQVTQSVQPAHSKPLPQPPAQKAQPRQDTRPQAPSQSKEEPPKPKEPPQKPTAQPNSNSKCDLDQSQLGGQIEQAEKSLARGKYKDASRQFESVLACDSGNARAQEGLTRVHQAELAEGSSLAN
jgi:hypothetical protein